MSMLAGFTLIELLVVIAIIFILGGVLLPALSRAKGKAHTITCQSHLKQWTLAMFFYTDNNEDVLPREKPFADAASWHISYNSWDSATGSTNREVWYNALPPLIGKTPLMEYASDPERRMGFYRPQSLFHCARAKFPVNQADYPMFSLAMNAKLMRGAIDTGKITCILEPSRTVLFFDIGLHGERTPGPAQPANQAFNGQPHGFAAWFSVRHDGSGNLAMADGHVQNLPGTKVVHPNGRALYPQIDAVWTCDAEDNPN